MAIKPIASRLDDPETRVREHLIARGQLIPATPDSFSTEYPYRPYMATEAIGRYRAWLIKTGFLTAARPKIIIQIQTH